MAPKTPSKTTQVTEVKLPAWVESASRNNYQFAQQIAAKPYKEYQGQTVAGVSPNTQLGYDLFKEQLGVGDSSFAKAGALFEKQGAGIAGMDRSAYMNPYLDEVEGKALGALDRQRVQALMGNSDKAIAAKAFGGDRSAIVDAITNSESINNAGLLSANLRKEGFDKTTSAMQADLAAAGQGGQGLLSQGNALIDQRGKDMAGLLGIGQQETQHQQKLLDDAKGRFDAKEGHDLERLNILLSSLGMSPYGKSESSTKITEGGSSGTDFAQLGLGILSIFAGLSDRDTKTDIKRVGTSKIGDIPLYSYRYKGDPKNYPKIVGPMAQDVEKAFPGSTGKTSDGKMTVPLGLLAKVANG